MFKLWVVVSISSEKVYGPFDSERDGIDWAMKQSWPKGFMVRLIEPIG